MHDDTTDVHPSTDDLLALSPEEVRELDPLVRVAHMKAALDAFGIEVDELQTDIGNFTLILSLGTQALELARRTVVAEFQMRTMQEELDRQKGEYEAQLAQMREELERRNVSFAHHQAAITELAGLRKELERYGSGRLYSELQQSA